MTRDMKNSLPTSYAQRRKVPRIPFSLDVDWGETRACVETGRVTSLSVGGCFIQTPLEVAEGKSLFIRLLLAPGSERGSEGLVWAQVLYHRPGLGIGVKFKKLPAGYGKHIEDIVEFHLSSNEDC
jgi:PilZ domain-containing protein